MNDRILWEYLEWVSTQSNAWREWHRYLAGWPGFNTFYTHYLRVENKRTKVMECTTPCEHNCPRRILDKSPSDITAACPQEKVEPVKLTFKDTLIYALRRESFHQALCCSLNIKYSAEHRNELKKVWHLGDYCGTEVYVTYRTAPKILADTISSLYLSCQKPFILMVPTVNSIAPEIQQFIARNNLFSMEPELFLQHDGSFRTRRGIAECTKLHKQPCPQAGQSTTLPIEAYKYPIYKGSE